MMTNTTITPETIDARSKELIEEFSEHRKEFTKAHPEITDVNAIFQGWAIQKIAFLQLIVLALEEHINEVLSLQ